MDKYRIAYDIEYRLAYCEAYQQGYEEGQRRAEARFVFNSIEYGLSKEQILRIFKIDEEKYREYLTRYERMQKWHTTQT